MVGGLVGQEGLDGVGELLEGEAGGTARRLLASDEVEDGRVLTVRRIMRYKEDMVLEPCDRSD